MTRGPRVLAALGLATALVGVPVEPVRAATTICVGVVVDYGAAKPGGGANSLCVRVAPGASGADVLAARARALGRPQPTYRSGLLCTIDGYPTDGSCGDPAPGGGYRYWSYWHTFPGSTSWTYSAAGALTFTVSDGMLEGWAFQDGGPERGRRPPAVGYSSVCQPVASPTPAASRTSSPAPSRHAVPPSARSSTAQPVGRASASTGPRPAPAGTSGPPRPAQPSAVGAPPSPAASASASSEPEVTTLSPAEPRPASPSRAPIVTLSGLALAAGIGAAALLRSRRARREGGG